MEFIKKFCPKCGKHLFDAAPSACGLIKAYCKTCHEPKTIELKGKT